MVTRHSDANARLKFLTIMSSGDVTLLFVTHSNNFAREFCERGIVLKKGVLQFDGPIDEAIEFYEKKDDN